MDIFTEIAALRPLVADVLLFCFFMELTLASSLAIHLPITIPVLSVAENAHEALKKGFSNGPESAVVNFNLAFVEAQGNDLQGAEKHLRTAFNADA